MSLDCNLEMTLKIFADLMSQPSRAVVLFCRVAKIPHEFKPLMLKNGEHLTEEMTKLNPFQKVSVLIQALCEDIWKFVLI